MFHPFAGFPWEVPEWRWGAAGAGILSEGELGFSVGWASEYHVIWRCLLSVWW